MQKCALNKKRRESGLAVPMVLGMITVIMLLMGGTSMLVLNSQRQTHFEFSREAQGDNVARAGLKAGIGWFKTHLPQPVKQDTSLSEHLCTDPDDPEGRHLAFFPQEDPINPEKSVTLDQSIGLVGEFKIQHPNIYGRYTLRRYRCDEAPNSEWNRKATKDTTFERGKNDGTFPRGQGATWELQSEGIVYLKNDSDKEPDEAPNRIIAQKIASQEIIRLSMSVPKSAVNLTGGSGNQSFFNNRCEIIGDIQTERGISRNSNTPNFSGSPTYSLPGAAVNSYAINPGLGESNKTIENTFNVTLEELKGVSNQIFTSVSQINTNEPLPFGIIFLDGNGSDTFTFTPNKQLRGSGVLFVHGNLTLQTDSNSSFTGLVYVTGHVTVAASNQIGGTLVANRVTCQPTTSAILEYNDSVMSNVRHRLGLYSENALSLNIRN